MKTSLPLLALLLPACSGSSFSTSDPPDAAADTAADTPPAADVGTMDAADALAQADGSGSADAARDAAAGDAGDAGDAGELGDVATDACAVVHDDGFGGHWTDCTALGTYSFAEAMTACTTHTGDAKYCADLGGGTDVVCSNQDSYPTCACWAYAGALAPGEVNHGQYGCHPPGGGLGTDTAWQ
jgi:hypothetical protein